MIDSSVLFWALSRSHTVLSSWSFHLEFPKIPDIKFFAHTHLQSVDNLC